MAHGSDDGTLGAWLFVARVLHVSPAYLVGWSDETKNSENPAVEPQPAPYFDFGAAIKELREDLDKPTHGVKITLDDGQVIYDSREYENVDTYGFVGEWLHLDSHSVAIKHIVSIEKVEED